MRRALALMAGPRLARADDRRGRTWSALLTSLGLHALVLGCVAAWTVLWWHRLPEPVEPPTVEVILNGGGAAVTGMRAAEAAPPAAPPPAPVPPAQEPAVAAAPPVPTDTPAQAAPPAPQPPPPQVADLTPLPPAAPVPAAATPPKPELPPVQQPPAPTPPPAQMASLTPPAPHPEGSPAIRLGDGVSGPMAELLNDDGIIHRAKAADGNIPPAYPLAAARRGEHGTVTLRLTVGSDGSVLEAAVAKSSGSPRLDQAARDQIATWHFTPATRDGKPQIDVIELGVDFVLD
jgi:periplasmic protein TonB